MPPSLPRHQETNLRERVADSPRPLYIWCVLAAVVLSAACMSSERKERLYLCSAAGILRDLDLATDAQEAMRGYPLAEAHTQAVINGLADRLHALQAPRTENRIVNGTAQELPYIAIEYRAGRGPAWELSWESWREGSMRISWTPDAIIRGDVRDVLPPPEECH